MTNGSYRHYAEWGGVPALAVARRIMARIGEPVARNEVVLVELDGAIQRGDNAGPAKLVFFLRESGLSAALFDATTQRIRGAGPSRPELVIAENSRAAAAARRLLEADGLTVRTRELNLQR